MNLHEFKNGCQLIDLRVQVTEHLTLPMTIRIRPSTTMHFERLLAHALLNRPMGVKIAMVREVEEFYPKQEERKIPLWANLYYRVCAWFVKDATDI